MHTTDYYLVNFFVATWINQNKSIRTSFCNDYYWEKLCCVDKVAENPFLFYSGQGENEVKKYSVHMHIIVVSAKEL